MWETAIMQLWVTLILFSVRHSTKFTAVTVLQGDNNMTKYTKLRHPLTSTGEENLDGGVLEEKTPGEDGADFREVPFPMQVVAVLENLQQYTTHNPIKSVAMALFVPIS